MVSTLHYRIAHESSGIRPWKRNIFLEATYLWPRMLEMTLNMRGEYPRIPMQRMVDSKSDFEEWR